MLGFSWHANAFFHWCFIQSCFNEGLHAEFLSFLCVSSMVSVCHCCLSGFSHSRQKKANRIRSERHITECINLLLALCRSVDKRPNRQTTPSLSLSFVHSFSVNNFRFAFVFWFFVLHTETQQTNKELKFYSENPFRNSSYWNLIRWPNKSNAASLWRRNQHAFFIGNRHKGEFVTPT